MDELVIQYYKEKPLIDIFGNVAFSIVCEYLDGFI